MYHKGDGCSHSSSQYQRCGWYSTFNTALIGRQSHSQGRQLCSECTRMCDCKPGNARRANLSLWTMVEKCHLVWAWLLLSQGHPLEDWENKEEQNENYVVVFLGMISCVCNDLGNYWIGCVRLHSLYRWWLTEWENAQENWLTITKITEKAEMENPPTLGRKVT